MNRFLSLLAAILVVTTAAAQAVSEQQALQTAKSFLAKKANAAGRKAPSKDASLRLSSVSAPSAKSMHVFNVGEGDGFVIVSANAQTPAIIGYADSGRFVEDSVPDIVRRWFEEYERQIVYLESHTSSVTSQPKQEEKTYAPIAPLVTSTWDQGNPYNQKAPLDTRYNGSPRSYTGCAATAMAQIVNYHKYPQQTKTAIPSYRSSTINKTMPSIPVTTIDWDNMRDSYNGSYSDASADAVSTLMLLCGQALRMDYSAEGSGAYSQDYAKAFISYFDYDPSLHLVSRDELPAAQWNDLVYGELAEGRPVLYSGQSTGGGHAFVIDGYSQDNLFHVNWGWGGSLNGYFLLSVLNPYSTAGAGASSSDDGYSYMQDALVGIRPNAGGEEASLVMTLYDMSVSGQTKLTRTDNGKFTVRARSSALYNQTGFRKEFQVALAMYDAQDNIVAMTSPESTGEIDNYSGIYGDVDPLSFGSEVADGLYKIKIVSRSNANAAFRPCVGTMTNYVEALVEGKQLTLATQQIQITGKVRAVGSLSPYQEVSLVASFTNEGLGFYEDLYLRVDGEIVGARHTEIPAHASSTCAFSFFPQSVGTKKVEVGYISGYSAESFTALASGEVNIQRGAFAANEYVLDFNVDITGRRSNGKVADNKVSGTVSLRNTGELDYDSYLDIALYQRQADDSYKYVTEQSYTLRLAVGQQTELPFAFDNLVYGETYGIVVWYAKDDENATYNNSIFSFTPSDEQAAGIFFLRPQMRIEEATAKGEVYGHRASVTIEVTNNSEADYNNEIIVALAQVNDEGSYSVVSTLSANVSIAKDQTDTFTADLTGLEYGEDYAIAFYYYEEEGSLVYHQQLLFFSTVAPEQQLAISYAIDNTERKGTKTRLNDSRVSGSATVVNRGDYLYDDPLRIDIRRVQNQQQYDLGLSYMLPAEIAQGDTLVVPLSFGPLENSMTYVVTIDYLTLGTLTTTTNNKGYLIFTTNFTEIPEAVASVTADGDAPVSVWSVSGQCVARTSRHSLRSVLASLPKAVYIVDGKKVMRK